MKTLAAIIPALMLLAGSCSGKDTEPADVAVVPLYEHINRFASLDSASRVAMMQADSAELAAFMAVVSGEPVSAATVGSWASSQAVEVFTPMVDSVFCPGATAPILGRILAQAAAEGLDIPSRRYAEVVYGRPESILFVDSVMLVALNHYLGDESPAYAHLPQYMRQAKTPAMLPYDIAEALVATSYPYVESPDATVLNRMLYEGALTYAKIRLTGGEASEALGYTPEQYRWLEVHEKEMWQALVARGIIFDTSQSEATRLVSPAPSVASLPGAPGRAGRFIGYRMVLSYIAGNGGGAGIADLLSPDFYHNPAILTEVSYNP